MLKVLISISELPLFTKHIFWRICDGNFTVNLKTSRPVYWNGS